MRFRLVLLVICGIGLALGWGGAARASAYKPYGWPVRPFNKAHPIRANFGDPRTRFEGALFANGLDGPGEFSFHNGVDVSAPDGTSVYPVVSGTVRTAEADMISVVTADGRTFQYYHLVPAVAEGQEVFGQRTVLGYVKLTFGHVHLTEIDGFHVVNPLLRGHLTPYGDSRPPRIAAIGFRRGTSLAELDPLAVCGRISIVADAYDTPQLRVPGAFAGLTVTPAVVRWQLRRLGGGVVIGDSVVADFRDVLPLQDTFWNVYARGTYQNAPRFGPRQYESMPGRYLFNLAYDLETKTLRNGVYVVVVKAADVRGHSALATRRFTIANVRGTVSGCPPEGTLPPR